jgi:hypothetical protein
VTKIMPIEPPISCETVLGERVGGPPLSEAKHYLFKRLLCGGIFDAPWGSIGEHQRRLPNPVRDRAQSRRSKKRAFTDFFGDGVAW